MRKLVLLLGALGVLVVPAGAQAAAVGINVPGGAASAPEAAAAAATGAKSARVFMDYPGGSNPGAELGHYRIVVDAYNAVGLRPLIVLTGRSAAGLDPNAYASYIGTLAKAYGSSVAAWEIWNEPDEAEYWGTAGGDPTAYAALLKAVYPKVSPHAKVFVGGLVGNDYEFLSKVYAAGGGGSFDGVATHTDTACSIVGPDSFYRDPAGPISRYSFLGIRSVHDVMAANGDGGKPIWITELGWNTSSATCDSGMWAGQKAAGVSPADQAKFLAQAWNCLNDYPYVENALWFNLHDTGSESSHLYGLKEINGAPKPALAVFQAVAAGRNEFAGQPCGDFSGPTITVVSPAAGVPSAAGRPLSISVSAADAQGVGRITLLVDNVKLRNFTTGLKDPAQFPKTLPGAINWMGGKKLAAGPHTLTVLAVDGSGNQTSQAVPFTVGGEAKAVKKKAKAKKKAKKRGKAKKRR